MPVQVRIRSTSAPAPAHISIDGTSARVRLAQAEEGVSPGQACVFYDETGAQVLGGGWISGTLDT